MAEKPCDCARCSGLATANAEWGYDEAKVAEVDCLSCGKPIGDAHYKLVTMLARFGQMMFEHTVCPPKCKLKLTSHPQNVNHS